MIITESQGKYLGTLGGTSKYVLINGEKNSYSREYTPGITDKLRETITNVGLKGWEEIGNDYSYTPFSLYDGRAFSSQPSSSVGGGYFLSTACDSKRRSLNCFQYALSTFGEELEKVAGKTMSEINQMYIEDVITSYFKKVIKRKDGDLAIYSIPKGHEIDMQRGQISKGTTHAGIYRNTRPNWNSPLGGTIESKWGFNSYNIFVHDVFFVPHFYGNIVKFYEIDKG